MDKLVQILLEPEVPLAKWSLNDLIYEFSILREEGLRGSPTNPLKDDWLDWYLDVKKELEKRASDEIVKRAFKKLNEEPGYREQRTKELGIKGEE